MGILDWLSGRKDHHTTASGPFDLIAAAEEQWRSGNPQAAEELFRNGIEAYRRRERSGVGFALGRYGAFLIDQKRIDEAARVLDEAIAGKTDIPAIWSDYLRIAADRRDLAAFTRGVDRMAASLPERIGVEFLLTYARRADREGAAAFAEAVARDALDRATRERDQDGRWAAGGDLGRILERADRAEEAAALWRSAFDEGSTDSETITRLSMYLERQKDYAGAVAVIETVLKRALPANVKESLRKRLARCEGKTGASRSSKKAQKRADVPAYSILQESPRFEPLFQLRVKPPVKDLELVGGVARCLLATKESATLVDIDVSSGAEVRRVENLPVLGDTWFAPDGAGIGIRRTAAVGKGPTLLRFLDRDGRVAAEATVPDATSEIALGPDLWYVGCRNGFLYGFGFDGKQRWSWETPGAKNYDGDSYFRPCPYYVASQQSFAAVASMGIVYAVAPNGRTMWQAELPNERETRWEFTVPFDGDSGARDGYRTLGLTPAATRDEVRSAYRRMALATHPDRNPDDDGAAAKFRQVQGAYERVLARADVTADESGEVTFSIEIQGSGPMASFVSANSGGVVVGSTQGRLYRFDAAGRLQEARVLGDGPVRAALRPDGTVAAAWCSDAVFFVTGIEIANAAPAPTWPRALSMFGDDVVLWRGNEIHVMDARGRSLWAVEFSKTVTGVAAHDDTLLCAAGVLAAFRRSNRD